MTNQSFWARLNISISPAVVLLLLVWISPVVSEPTSYNDPFRAIVLHTSKPADPPICCLKPLPPLEPVEDDLRLSFEEWKAKQQNSGSENISETFHQSTGNSNARGNTNESENAAEGSSPTVADEDSNNIPVLTTQEALIEFAPHARIPLNDRFNYASLDCSARVHAAHKSAKHSSNVLSSKKDRYMLSPCKTKAEKQYVIVELCEDIRIDTVQMANFEFFSGVFKDFTVSVAKRYDEESFVYAGTYRAKNVRGVQSFHTPSSLRDFYRFLRIDFLSHYGSEYYCPVSLLRVYGLTHLEEWKLELWEAESKTKTQAALKEAQDHPTGEVLPALGTINNTAFSTRTKEVSSERSQTPITSQNLSVSKEVKQSEILLVTTHINAIVTPPDAYITPSTPSESLDGPTTLIHAVSTTTLASIISASATDLSVPASSPSTTIPNPSIIPSKVNSASDELNVTGTTMVSILASLSASPPPNNASPIPTRASSLSPNPTGGSIYRTIMNRLGELESNHTLFGKYVGQQQSLVREALIRLSEDVGRLEGVGKAQRQALDRVAHEWEKQRKQWQMEHAQLLRRVEYLSEEIIMEKRLGVAQLCLLLAVLVFISLTRGSRGPVVDDRRRWRKALSLGSLSDLRNLRREPDNVRFVTSDDERHRIPSSVDSIKVTEPVKALSESIDTDASATTRYPLPSVTLNTPPSERGKEENRRPERFEDYPHTASTNTPPRNRTRTISRTRSRTSSATKGVLLQGSHFNNGAGTPSKSSRSVGRPSNLISSMRANTAIPPHFKRQPPPLQRSHSTHASPTTGEYMIGNGWIVSGNMLKSTRKWARTAHLHEVKGRRRESERAVQKGGKQENVYGDGGGDVFSDKSNIGNPNPKSWAFDEKERERAMTLILKSEDTDGDGDGDGWEDASDVSVDALDGI